MLPKALFKGICGRCLGHLNCPDEALEVRPIIWRWMPSAGGLDFELRSQSGLDLKAFNIAKARCDRKGATRPMPVLQ